MLKWKTLDYEEIDLLLSKKSLDALQKYRDDNEKKRKQSTGKILSFDPNFSEFSQISVLFSCRNFGNFPKICIEEKGSYIKKLLGSESDEN